MNEIIIRIKDWKEQAQTFGEQFELFINGEKVPRVTEFSMNIKNDSKHKYCAFDPSENFSYTIKQHIDWESWEHP